MFGYRNNKVYIGVDAHCELLKSHTERAIKPDEAVVQRIFELYDSGFGLKAIAKRLTLEKALAPIPFIKRVHVLPTSPFDSSTLAPVRSWAPSTVRGVLSRELYHGSVVWGKTRKKDRGQTRRDRARPCGVGDGAA